MPENASTLSLQDRFAPNLICFGCGPANTKGLRIKSYASEDGTVTAHFEPAVHHQAFEGMLNGGIIGTLVDCHMNWTAAWTLMQNRGADKPPCTVTSEFSVRFSKPTPVDNPIKLIATAISSSDRKVETRAELWANDELTATSTGVFVAVKEGHPAWHRW